MMTNNDILQQLLYLRDKYKNLNKRPITVTDIDISNFLKVNPWERYSLGLTDFRFNDVDQPQEDRNPVMKDVTPVILKLKDET
jgi:hypothetical protein